MMINTEQIQRDIAFILSQRSVVEIDGVMNAHCLVEVDSVRVDEKSLASLYVALARQKKWRLGHYYEQLVQWIFQQQGRCLFTNAQVRDAHHTYGEFDLIWSDNSNKYHVEIANKYYLSVAKSDDWDGWIGINVNDTLGAKIRHMIGHQLALSQHEVGHARLGEWGVENVIPALWIQGWFFAPYAEFIGEKVIWPIGATVQRNKGWWVRESEKQHISLTEDMRWCVLEKAQWISPYAVVSDAELYRADEWMELEISADSSREPLVALLRWNGEQWEEVSRGFVVSDDWNIT